MEWSTVKAVRENFEHMLAGDYEEQDNGSIRICGDRGILEYEPSEDRYFVYRYGVRFNILPDEQEALLWALHFEDTQQS